MHPRDLPAHLDEPGPVGGEGEHVVGRGLDLARSGRGLEQLRGAVGAAHQHRPLPAGGGGDRVPLAERCDLRGGGAAQRVDAGGEHGGDGEGEGHDEREARGEERPRPAAQATAEQGDQQHAEAGPGEHPGRETQRTEQEVAAEQGADPGEREQHHRQAQRRRRVRRVLTGRRLVLAHRGSP